MANAGSMVLRHELLSEQAAECEEADESLPVTLALCRSGVSKGHATTFSAIGTKHRPIFRFTRLTGTVAVDRAIGCRKKIAQMSGGCSLHDSLLTLDRRTRCVARGLLLRFSAAIRCLLPSWSGYRLGPSCPGAPLLSPAVKPRAGIIRSRLTQHRGSNASKKRCWMISKTSRSSRSKSRFRSEIRAWKESWNLLRRTAGQKGA